jgi:murein DD-endopeptidase MepM/ murein hydrolase activator NlpD
VIPTRRNATYRALLGVGGLLCVGIVTVALPSGPPQVEPVLEPVFARPAETVRIRALGRGQTLGEVLEDALAPAEQQRLVMAFREQASPRRMRVNTEIMLRYRPAPEGEAAAGERWLRGVDVALNPDETVRLTRDAFGWHSAMIRTPTWTDTIYAAGQIEDVLWNAVIENPVLDELPVKDRALLIHHLDKIFQWQIDFSRQIQRGDSYRFVFERLVRPDGSMRAGHVIAAELVNSGTPFHAVWFDPNGDGDGTYYDLDGKSVRRAFLMKPLEFRRISSRYSTGRFHPVLKRTRAHRGVDYAADRGTPIMATADGVVTHRGPLGGLGNAVVIRHPNGFLTRYGHMSRFAPDVHVGTRVRQEQVIGYVGATGLATGPHLHYEMWRSGRPVDPLAIELPAGDPVPTDAMDRWSDELPQRLALLESLPSPVSVLMAKADRRADRDHEDEVQQDGPADL